VTQDLPVVGRIGRPHGVKGEVTVRSDSDDPDRFTAGATLFTADGRSLLIASSRPYRDAGFLIRFDGIEDRNAAELMRGVVLHAPPGTTRALGEGEFWASDLVGLTAVEPGGRVLGTVVDIEFAAQDRLVIETDRGAQILVPFVSDLVDDPEGDRIVVRPPEGLLDG
jgi:16S rRNA processing protein RimM